MSSSDYPIGHWGKVVASRRSDEIERVRIDRKGTGFNIITKEPSGVFDVWVESDLDVVDFLREVDVEWEA